MMISNTGLYNAPMARLTGVVVVYKLDQRPAYLPSGVLRAEVFNKAGRGFGGTELLRSCPAS